MDNYKYSGVKLFPAVFKELLVLLFDGKQFTRQIAIKKVTDFHLEHGGIIEEGRDVVAIFRKLKPDWKIKAMGLGNYTIKLKIQQLLLRT